MSALQASARDQRGTRKSARTQGKKKKKKEGRENKGAVHKTGSHEVKFTCSFVLPTFLAPSRSSFASVPFRSSIPDVCFTGDLNQNSVTLVKSKTFHGKTHAFSSIGAREPPLPEKSSKPPTSSLRGAREPVSSVGGKHASRVV